MARRRTHRAHRKSHKRTRFAVRKGQQDGSPFSQHAELFRQGETTEFAGIAVVHLAADPKRHQKTGRILLTGELGREYGFKDLDGSSLLRGGFQGVNRTA